MVPAEDAQFPEKLHVFSSNYELYASMSARVMTHLEELATRVEQYSIDEIPCFWISASTAALTLKTSAGNYVSMLVTVRTHHRMGPTKTLAKSAQWASKEWPQFGGVLASDPGNPRRTEKLLSLQPVEEIWGVGRRILKTLGIMVSPLRCSWRAKN